MRRLLPAIVTLGLLLGLAAPAMATSRVPKGITKVSLTLTFPPSASNPRSPAHKTITQAASVAAIVSATNALKLSTTRVMCPMILRLGPELTVSFRNAKGATVAEASAGVTMGSKANDGSSPCFPIRFLATGGKTMTLLGNSWIRMMGRMIGTAIS